MTTSVNDLTLPEITDMALGREGFRAVLTQARRDGHWLVRLPIGVAVMNHDDVAAVLRDRRFHSAVGMITQMAGALDEDFGERTNRSILTMEGEPHSRLRRLVAPAFSPKAADRLRPFMREVVTGLVDAMVAKGRGDLVLDVCEPYPIPIICELLGAPKEDWKLFSEWATKIFKIFNGNIVEDLPVIQEGFAELDVYVRDLIAARRSDPRDDLLSAMIAAEEDGDRLSTDELVMMTEAVLMAGTDTTRNQLACAVAVFTEHPDQWKLLAEQPELAPQAVEECMRYLGAVAGTARIASEDIVYRDVLFPSGTFVETAFIGANFDPQVFANPETFDITRSTGTTTHFSFGSGIHFCMGAALARAELQEALPILATKLARMKVDGEIEWKAANIGIWGPARLPLVW